MALEVCIDSLESALNAFQGGADEIEICSCLSEGGLTPSAGLVQCILNEVKNKVKLNIMLRCRPGSDFNYSEPELVTMLEDIKFFKQMNIHSFVFGALTDTGTIDKKACARVIDAARPIPVTFHRAFDLSSDPYTALEDIISLGFKRLLTSGQQDSAAEPDALKLIKSLKAHAKDRIEIMPGAGINQENFLKPFLVSSGIIHSSCKTVKSVVSNNSVNLGNVKSNECSDIYVCDKNKVIELKNALVSAAKNI